MGLAWRLLVVVSLRLCGMIMGLKYVRILSRTGTHLSHYRPYTHYPLLSGPSHPQGSSLAPKFQRTSNPKHQIHQPGQPRKVSGPLQPVLSVNSSKTILLSSTRPCVGTSERRPMRARAAQGRVRNVWLTLPTFKMRNGRLTIFVYTNEVIIKEKERTPDPGPRSWNRFRSWVVAPFLLFQTLLCFVARSVAHGHFPPFGSPRL
jgi:hypothetical protein